MNFHFWISLICLFLLVNGYNTPSESDYNTYRELENALSNSSYALFSIRELFFPSVGRSPLCTPIIYELTCTTPQNYSFLWTQYDSRTIVGQILVSFAYYGVTLRGFDWENSCWFFRSNERTPVLRLNFSDCSIENLEEQLFRFTAVLKAYGTQKSSSSLYLSGDTIATYRGYSINWTQEKEDDEIFHISFSILAALIVVLDLFVLFFSLGLCTSVYDAVYDKIKHKKNPYYPLFWAAVIIAILWDVAPGWLILASSKVHVRASLGIMVPIQLFLAFLMKKYADFPIPGMNWKKLSLQYQGYRIDPSEEERQSENSRTSGKPDKPHHYFIWEITKMRFPCRVFISFCIQTIAVWSLLILFTYIVIYTVTIAIALYLYPVQTLVKIIFVKAVAMCTVFDVAILFSTQSFTCAFNKRAIYTNITLLGKLLAVLSFLPLLAFLTFVIGGIIFTDSSQQLSGVQGVLALLPSVFLLLVGWYTKGQLFPEELTPSDSMSDLKKNEESVATVTNDSEAPSIQSARPSLAEKAKAYIESSSSGIYGSTDPRKPGEGDPLLPTKAV